MLELTESPLDPRAAERAVAHPGAGCTITFCGTTRDSFEGRPVVGLSYEAYGGMAQATMAEIAAEIAERWPGCRVAAQHRLGDVPVGEISVVIAVSSPHRGPCYEASRYAIEQLKARVPIWKKERYADGAEWKGNT